MSSRRVRRAIEKKPGSEAGANPRLDGFRQSFAANPP